MERKWLLGSVFDRKDMGTGYLDCSTGGEKSLISFSAE